MGTEEKQTVKGPDAISEELYAAVANLGRDREQKIVTASASGEEGLLQRAAKTDCECLLCRKSLRKIPVDITEGIC